MPETSECTLPSSLTPNGWHLWLSTQPLLHSMCCRCPRELLIVLVGASPLLARGGIEKAATLLAQPELLPLRSGYNDIHFLGEVDTQQQEHLHHHAFLSAAPRQIIMYVGAFTSRSIALTGHLSLPQKPSRQLDLESKEGCPLTKKPARYRSDALLCAWLWHLIFQHSYEDTQCILQSSSSVPVRSFDVALCGFCRVYQAKTSSLLASESVVPWVCPCAMMPRLQCMQGRAY